ncbi:hypothetical protein L596_028475 [Steinernema carpocapsae]|uniref:Chitin-binding type-2 domain-containing protein n=1 Tax=Steinernema carpocapsae TaxID=34508 RepID=A0A4U5LYL9_STECR|nr:hypothetical protein L596_028475 [Steinernema carpocapsae]
MFAPLVSHFLLFFFVSPIARSNPEFNCSKLEEGAYVIGCSRNFTMCIKNNDGEFQTFEYSCPHNELFFDPDENSCRPHYKVRNCKMQRRRTTHLQ